MVTQGCRCGHRGDPRRDCTCEPAHVERYRARLSGPLLDRIDLHVEVPPLGYRDLLREQPGESSEAVRRRVLACRERQRARFAALEADGDRPSRRRREPCNAELRPDQLRAVAPLDAKGRGLLERAVEQLGLSARAHDRALRVARTIADLDGAASVGPRHLAEAIHYRTLDRPVG